MSLLGRSQTLPFDQRKDAIACSFVVIDGAGKVPLNPGLSRHQSISADQTRTNSAEGFLV
jgi:hypothetical protein